MGAAACLRGLVAVLVAVPVDLGRGVVGGAGHLGAWIDIGGLQPPFVGARWTFLRKPRSAAVAVGVTWSAHAQLLAMHYDVLLPVMPLLQVGIVVELGRPGTRRNTPSTGDGVP